MAAPATPTVALLGADYPGVRPELLVAVNARVALGEPLFRDRHDPAVVFTSPGTGIVTAIHHGERRRLQAVVVTLENAATGAAVQPTAAAMAGDGAALRDLLLKTGLWCAFRTRPYSRVPASGDAPAAIFVTAMDSAPLALDPRVAMEAAPQDLSAGLQALTRLTGGPVFLCREPGPGPALPLEARVEDVIFEGPHPAGLPGTHIHHLFPAGSGREVWHVGVQDVIAMGTLLLSGRLEVGRAVGIGGGGVTPRVCITRLGASLEALVMPSGAGQIISGSVLTGRRCHAQEAWLGRYHTQITVLPPVTAPRPFSWLRRPRVPQDQAVHGRSTGMLPLAAFDQVVPLDILPAPLLRALLTGDDEAAVSLGALELDEEDLALCSYLCPARLDYGAALRATLDRVRRSG